MKPPRLIYEDADGDVMCHFSGGSGYYAWYDRSATRHFSWDEVKEMAEDYGPVRILGGATEAERHDLWIVNLKIDP